MAKSITKILFLFYLGTIVWILIFKLGVKFSYMDNRRVNLIPFGGRLVLNGEIIMNTLIFIPLGVYVGILFRKWTFLNKILFCFLFSLLIETLQYLIKIGAFDITDLITNTSGGIIGLILLKALEKIFKNDLKTQKFINIIATIGTVSIILFLILLKLNFLPIRYQ